MLRHTGASDQIHWDSSLPTTVGCTVDFGCGTIDMSHRLEPVRRGGLSELLVQNRPAVTHRKCFLAWSFFWQWLVWLFCFTVAHVTVSLTVWHVWLFCLHCDPCVCFVYSVACVVVLFTVWHAWLFCLHCDPCDCSLQRDLCDRFVYSVACVIVLCTVWPVWLLFTKWPVCLFSV